MSHIALITDTDASLPAEVAARQHITLVPISVQFGAQTYDTGITIDDQRLFERVKREGRLPTTAAPTPGQYAEAYQAALDQGAYAVICLCVSSKVSAAYQSALTARDLMPGCDITVVDSQTLSMGQGYMALRMAEALQNGASKEEAIARAEDLRSRTHLFAALSTLKYLAMSGRVGHLAAGMATLLDVKPILTIRDGKLGMLERVRTQKRAWARLCELVVQAAGGQPIERMALLHVNAAPEARQFQQQLCTQLRCPPSTLEAELTPGLSVHAGDGVIGVVIVSSAAQ
jgi:DegV family protein with EDD domain